MQPKAIRTYATAREADGLLRVEETGHECVLDSFAELIWELSDGSRSVVALAQAASRVCSRPVSQEEVFSALDFLADAGLVEERAAPPVAEGNVSRRALLGRLAPVVGAAWIASQVSTRAAGLLQYNESDSKESSNKEYNRKASDREITNKEIERKSQNRESDDKRDWDRQQDAEKQRKKDMRRTFDEINESESKRSAAGSRARPALTPEQLEQQMRASWPKIYELVGHRLSEFPELLLRWQRAERIALAGQHLTATNYAGLFEKTERNFEFQLRLSGMGARFANAGFTLPSDLHAPPVLAGDTQNKTYLKLDHITNLAVDENWRYALSAENLRFEFADPQAAFEFLSARQNSKK